MNSTLMLIIMLLIPIVFLLFKYYPMDIDQEPVIETNYGKIRGAYDNKTGGKVFLGIPFAQPPVGPNRFKPPKSYLPWEGTKDALKLGSSCLQVSGLITKSEFLSNQSEDCLFLNIWTPNVITKPLAVMVWIHGGAFISGSSSEPYYKGNLLSQRGDVIVVTLNYRLGMFGFMASNELAKEDPLYPTSGNYGILDQNMALRWVKENIIHFGGDPSNITIFGESAGAMSVCFHMIMPLSKNLFNRVIRESGTCAFPNYSSDKFGNQLLYKMNYKYWTVQSMEWMTEMNCKDINCMRNTSADKILEYTKNNNLKVNPIVDGYVVPDDPIKSFQSGNFHKVDVLLGNNLHEGSLWSSEYIFMKNEEYKESISKLFPNNNKEIIKMYSIENYGFPAASASNLIRDMAFLCTGNELLRMLSRNESNLYYQYFFTHIPSYLPKYMKFIGSFHGAEIPHVFDNPNDTHANPENESFTKEEQEFTYQIQEYWTSFAKTGIPKSKDGPVWSSQKFNIMNYMELRPNGMMIKRDLKRDECDLYEKTVISEV